MNYRGQWRKLSGTNMSSLMLQIGVGRKECLDMFIILYCV